jgi:hypothetical protein
MGGVLRTEGKLLHPPAAVQFVELRSDRECERDWPGCEWCWAWRVWRVKSALFVLHNFGAISRLRGRAGAVRAGGTGGKPSASKCGHGASLASLLLGDWSGSADAWSIDGEPLVPSYCRLKILTSGWIV